MASRFIRNDKASKEEEQQQLLLLTQHRSNLAALLQQKAMHGAASTPLVILNGILESRTQIRRIKAILSSWSVDIREDINDEPAAWAWDEFDTHILTDVDWEAAAQRYMVEIRRLYGAIRILGMPAPAPLEGLFTDVYLLDKPNAWRRYTIEELRNMNQHFEKESEAKLRLNGVNVVKDTPLLYVLGKPGAGKTTFLKYLALQAVECKINAIPIFISLKSWADSQLSLDEFLIRQFEICALPNAQEFIQYTLKQGKALILFDGLDEVDQEQQANANMIGVIRDFADQYRFNRCVITCRIAASDYQFERFTYYEIADFTEQQVHAFVSKWFSNDEKKCDAFINEFSRPEHIGLRDLARTPLLLTLLCINFDETMSFPVRRAEIYEEALDTLLKKWDSSRSIRRDLIYRKLSIGHKRQMLMRIAVETFAKNEIFMRQLDLERRINTYLQTLPLSQVDTEIADGTTVLSAIEAQHGLLVERAQNIYSFSHLTLHEYFTARYIAHHPSVRIFKGVTAYAGDPRWREVLLLASSMLDAENATMFFNSFLVTLDTMLYNSPNLLSLSKWLTEGPKLINEDNFEVRVFYLCSALLSQIIYEITRIGASSQGIVNIIASTHAFTSDLINSLVVALDYAIELMSIDDLDKTFVIMYDLVQALEPTLARICDNTRATTSKYVRENPSSSTNYFEDTKGFYLAEELIQAHDRLGAFAECGSHIKGIINQIKYITPIMILDHKLRFICAITRAIINLKPFDSDLKFTNDFQVVWDDFLGNSLLQHSKYISLYKSLQQLIVPQWHESQLTWQNFSDHLIKIIRAQSNSYQSWSINKDEYNQLKIYIDSIELMLKCLDLAAVTNREGIRNRLLLSFTRE